MTGTEIARQISRWPDGVEAYQADTHALAGYEQARQQLAQFQAPILVSHDNPHSRMFVACFDGTGNDKSKLPDEATNVANIYDQVKRAKNPRIAGSYQPGVGTQDDGFVKSADGAIGYSYSPKMEQMYYDFCVQAKAWLDADPKAQISVAATGFSRGAVTAAMFTRMVEERGIQDPVGMSLEKNAEGLITRSTPTQPNLVPPHQTPQVVGLFDPVATGAMNHIDVRLPPSVVSGFQITSLDERRDEFQSKQIVDPGMTADGRFLAVKVNGAHCDVGGSYKLDGLSLRNGNMMIDYLNATSDRPFLRDHVVPTAAEMNVIHRSEQHEWFYTRAVNEALGERGVTRNLTGPSLPSNSLEAMGALNPASYDAEPRNERLNQGLHHRHVPVPAQQEDPTLPLFFRDRPQLPPSVDFNQLLNNAPTAQLDKPERKDPLLDALWARLPPGTSREKAEEVKLAARIGGIERPEQLDRIDYKDGDPRAFVMGTVPGFRAAVDLAAPAPALETSREREQAHDLQQSQALARFQQEQVLVNQNSPHMSRGAPPGGPQAMT
jgi:hypothetical protein